MSHGGWFVFENKVRAPEGHFVADDVKTVCEHRVATSIVLSRPWRVEQDVGRIPLCEACKTVLRG